MACIGVPKPVRRYTLADAGAPSATSYNPPSCAWDQLVIAAASESVRIVRRRSTQRHEFVKRALRDSNGPGFAALTDNRHDAAMVNRRYILPANSAQLGYAETGRVQQPNQCVIAWPPFRCRKKLENLLL
jgi:hypothetical protein